MLHVIAMFSLMYFYHFAFICSLPPVFPTSRYNNHHGYRGLRRVFLQAGISKMDGWIIFPISLIPSSINPSFVLRANSIGHCPSNHLRGYLHKKLNAERTPGTAIPCRRIHPVVLAGGGCADEGVP